MPGRASFSYSFGCHNTVCGGMQGILVSKGMLFDHSMHKLMSALNEAAAQIRSKQWTDVNDSTSSYR